MNPKSPVAFWLSLYPSQQLYPFTPVKFTASAAHAAIAYRAGAGNRAAGLAQLFAWHHRSALLYAAAAREALFEDPCVRMLCPICSARTATDEVWTSAHCRTPVNPLGIYGCSHCTQWPFMDPDDAKAVQSAVAYSDPDDCDDPFEPVNLVEEAPRRTSAATLRARARRVLSVSTPAPAVEALYQIHTTLPGAYRRLIRLHIELSTPPPDIRRLATERTTQA